MNIQFSTNSPLIAWEYIQRAMPGVPREIAQPLLDLVGTQVRIGDPTMYDGQAPVYSLEGANWEEITAACLSIATWTKEAER